MFKIGDRVVFICDNPDENDYGAVIGFDEDGDPRVLWGGDTGTISMYPDTIRLLTPLEQAME